MIRAGHRVSKLRRSTTGYEWTLIKLKAVQTPLNQAADVRGRAWHPAGFASTVMAAADTNRPISRLVTVQRVAAVDIPLNAGFCIPVPVATM
jgi:hypothetical protein